MDGEEPYVVRVRVVAEAPHVVASLMQDWGESGPPGEEHTRQKTLTIQQIPLLVRVDVSFQQAPAFTRKGKWDPSPVLSGCDAILFVYREDEPATYSFLKDFCKAARSNRFARMGLSVATTAVLCVHDGDPHREADGRARKLAMSIGAVSTFRLSGMGTPVGFDAVLEDFAVPAPARYYAPPPWQVVAVEDPRRGVGRESLLTRLWLWWMD